MNDPFVNKDVAKTIVQKYLCSCPNDHLEDKIFSIVCPFLKQSIFDIIEDVEKKLDDPEVMKNLEPTTFDSQFIDIKNFLARWLEILRHLLSFSSKPSIIKSVLEYLPSVVIKICSHCKDNRTKYLNRALPLLLQDIYRDACSIVKTYCALVPKSCKFDCKLESDVDALKLVIKSLADMAPHTAYGMSTMIQTWRTFKHVTCVDYLDILTKKDCVDLVRGYFKSIGNDIIRLYKHIMMRPQGEFISRAKCSNLLMEIYVELHESYCTDQCPYPLDAEFVHDMVRVLIEFIGYYELCRAWNFDTGKAFHRDQIIRTSWPKFLIDYYKNSEHFLPAFYAESKEIANMNNPDYALGFHYCLLHYKVFNIQESFDMALENINHIQVEIMQQLIRVEGWGTAEAGPWDARIYEYTMVMLCRSSEFVQKSDSFIKYERILLKHLLSEQFWSSLLAYDILMFCYACSNKDVALTHIKYFMMAYETLQKRKDDSLAVMMLHRMIIDIYKILPKTKVKELLETCKSPVSLLLILKSGKIKYNLREEVITTYKKLMFSEPTINLPEAIENLQQQPSVKNWTRLVDILTVMGIEQDEKNEQWTEHLIEITFSIFQSLKELENNKFQRMMYDLILILFDCARFQTKKSKKNEKIRFNWPLFATLAEGLIELTDVPESFLIKLCHYLSDNANCLIGPNDGENSIVPNLFIYLLENDSQLVHQEALECFDQVVEKSNEDIVKEISSAIAKRPKLCEAVPAYLKKEEFPKQPDDHSMPEGWRNYLTISSVFNEFSVMHRCYKDEVRARDEKLPKLCEELLEERVIKLTNELIKLTRENINSIPDAVEKLKNACHLFIEK
ncbi:hypothetical protein PV328_002020 [Microctonus aethiopoides]|uniref:Uncharacterized protein n=1 Tax=Microctonus aethiopoides TaxID=144406 RepID=A0AA39FY75_9HYME|nr:hypothetical protein PV328_002020 [Microctonus aethiopoides]